MLESENGAPLCRAFPATLLLICRWGAFWLNRPRATGPRRAPQPHGSAPHTSNKHDLRPQPLTTPFSTMLVDGLASLVAPLRGPALH